METSRAVEPSAGLAPRGAAAPIDGGEDESRWRVNSSIEWPLSNWPSMSCEPSTQWMSGCSRRAWSGCGASSASSAASWRGWGRTPWPRSAPRKPNPGRVVRPEHKAPLLVVEVAIGGQGALNGGHVVDVASGHQHIAPWAAGGLLVGGDLVEGRRCLASLPSRHRGLVDAHGLGDGRLRRVTACRAQGASQLAGGRLRPLSPVAACGHRASIRMALDMLEVLWRILICSSAILHPPAPLGGRRRTAHVATASEQS